MLKKKKISLCAVLTQSCPTLSSRGLTRLLCLWNFPGKDTTVGCHFLLQRAFLTQGLKLCLLHLLHWQEDLFFFFFNHWATWETSISLKTLYWVGQKVILGFFILQTSLKELFGQLDIKEKEIRESLKVKFPSCYSLINYLICLNSLTG